MVISGGGLCCTFFLISVIRSITQNGIEGRSHVRGSRTTSAVMRDNVGNSYQVDMKRSNFFQMPREGFSEEKSFYAISRELCYLLGL